VPSRSQQTSFRKGFSRLDGAVTRAAGMVAPMITTVEIKGDRNEKVRVSESLVRQMYDLLGTNMTQIVAGANADWQSDAAFSKWKNEVFLGEVHRHTSHLLVLDEKGLRGFLSYTAAPDTEDVYLNELQIRASCRIDGVTLRRLIRMFAVRIREIPQDHIRTYSNKANTFAHGLAKKTGFTKVGKTDRGYRYRMHKRQFLDRFLPKGPPKTDR